MDKSTDHRRGDKWGFRHQRGKCDCRATVQESCCAEYDQLTSKVSLSGVKMVGDDRGGVLECDVRTLPV